MLVVNSFLSGIRMMGREARRAAVPFVLLFPFERGPNSVRPWMQDPPQAGCMLREGSASGGARTSNSGRFPGIGEK